MESIIFDMPESKYYLFTLLDENLINEIIKLEIDPKPDVMRRIIFGVKLLNEPVLVEEPNFLKIERNGFTVVEWGLCFLDD